MEIKVREWINEDEMTEKQMYNALFPLSRVDIVRLFPKSIEVFDDTIINQWIVGNDTGISSKTLWMAMKGIEPSFSSNLWADIPHDADDFGRCFRLMMVAHYEQRHRAFKNIGKICPKWIPLVREWNKLESLYVDGMHEGNYSKFNDLLDELKREGEGYA